MNVPLENKLYREVAHKGLILLHSLEIDGWFCDCDRQMRRIVAPPEILFVPVESDTRCHNSP